MPPVSLIPVTIPIQAASPLLHFKLSFCLLGTSFPIPIQFQPQKWHLSSHAKPANFVFYLHARMCNLLEVASSCNVYFNREYPGFVFVFKNGMVDI
jgi:hypothetical protein